MAIVLLNLCVLFSQKNLLIRLIQLFIEMQSACFLFFKEIIIFAFLTFDLKIKKWHQLKLVFSKINTNKINCNILLNINDDKYVRKNHK